VLRQQLEQNSVECQRAKAELKQAEDLAKAKSDTASKQMVEIKGMQLAI
jgi:hypothetical protein